MEALLVLERVSRGEIPVNQPSAVTMRERKILQSLIEAGYCSAMASGYSLTTDGVLALHTFVNQTY